MKTATDDVTSNRIEESFKKLKTRAGILREEPLKKRIKLLENLERWLHTNRERVRAAVHEDMKKPLLEVDTSELYPVVVEIRHIIRNLEQWARPKKVDATLAYVGTRSEIRFEPKGVCLIISPWNFPFNLAMGPLVSCLAAGNSAIIKPSEMTPRTSHLLYELVQEVLNDRVEVVEGGVEESTSLLSLPFDHIFFTGSPAVGKIVMKAAAQHLASVTLELGGKSPAIVDATADLKDTAKRIAFGKFLNNGQTCIAPDYLLVEESVKEELIDLMKFQVQELFGRGQPVNEKSEDYSRLINAKHFQRVNGLLKEAMEKGAHADLTGGTNENTCFMSPVILSEIPRDSKILEEEIFGPLLPVLTFSQKEEAILEVNSRPKPLALYLFSRNNDFREFVLRNTSAGSVCVNDCVLQFTHPNLPFGGVNNSGIGKSHGHAGFLAFSNEKPILKQRRGWAGPYLLHPPYTSKMKRIVDVLLKWF